MPSPLDALKFMFNQPGQAAGMAGDMLTRDYQMLPDVDLGRFANTPVPLPWAPQATMQGMYDTAQDLTTINPAWEIGGAALGGLGGLALKRALAARRAAQMGQYAGDWRAAARAGGGPPGASALEGFGDNAAETIRGNITPRGAAYPDASDFQAMDRMGGIDPNMPAPDPYRQHMTRDELFQEVYNENTPTGLFDAYENEMWESANDMYDTQFDEFVRPHPDDFTNYDDYQRALDQLDQREWDEIGPETGWDDYGDNLGDYPQYPYEGNVNKMDDVDYNTGDYWYDDGDAGWFAEPYAAPEELYRAIPEDLAGTMLDQRMNGLSGYEEFGPASITDNPMLDREIMNAAEEFMRMGADPEQAIEAAIMQFSDLLR